MTPRDGYIAPERCGLLEFMQGNPETMRGVAPWWLWPRMLPCLLAGDLLGALANRLPRQ